MGQHVGDQGLAGAAGSGAGEHVAARITAAQIVHIGPGQIIPAGLQHVGPQFPDRGQGLGGLGARSIRIGEVPGGGQRVAVKQPHPRGPLARGGILHPFAQQVGGVVAGAVGLALIDVRGGVVLVVGAGGDPGPRCGVLESGLVVGRAVNPIHSGADDIVMGAEFPVRSSRRRIRDRGATDPELALIGAVERIVRGERNINFRGGTIDGVAAFVNEIEAVIKELAKQHLPAGDAGVAHDAMGKVANDRFLEIQTIRIGGTIRVVAADLERSRVDVGDLIDLHIIDHTTRFSRGGGSGEHVVAQQR